MNRAIIYQPTRNAMQSGKAKTRYWLLEFERNLPMAPDALMGWNTMSETVPQQLHLKFPTREEAIAYAQAHGIPYRVREPQREQVGPKSYAENFAFGRRRSFAAH